MKKLLIILFLFGCSQEFPVNQSQEPYQLFVQPTQDSVYYLLEIYYENFQTDSLTITAMVQDSFFIQYGDYAHMHTPKTILLCNSLHCATTEIPANHFTYAITDSIRYFEITVAKAKQDTVFVIINNQQYIETYQFNS